MTGNRAAVLIEPGRVVVEDRPAPEVGAGEVLLEILAVGVCGSDVHYFERGRIGDFVVDAPLVLGHEASGRILQVGEGVSDRHRGQRVAIEPGIPCGRCLECRTGRYNLCPEVRFLATPPVDGAFTRRMVMPAVFTYPVPDQLSDAAAALIEPLAVGVWANQKAQTGPGTSVLITGSGPVGLLAASVARARGATELVTTDVSPERRAAAARLGFTSCAPDVVSGRFDALIECSGAPAAIHAGLLSLGSAGRAVLVGMPPTADITVPISALQRQEVTLTGSFRYANAYPAAIALAASGLVDLEAFVSRTFALGEVEQALRAPGADPTIIKAIVEPQRD